MAILVSVYVLIVISNKITEFYKYLICCSEIGCHQQNRHCYVHFSLKSSHFSSGKQNVSIFPIFMRNAIVSLIRYANRTSSYLFYLCVQTNIICYLRTNILRPLLVTFQLFSFWDIQDSSQCSHTNDCQAAVYIFIPQHPLVRLWNQCFIVIGITET